MFLLPDLNLKLRPRLLELRPGTRIVSNTWDLGEWTADDTVVLDPCPGFCTALLWIVPARVAGTWTLPTGTLTLEQEFQLLSGTIDTGDGSAPISDGRMRGSEISFRSGGVRYSGRVRNGTIDGTASAGSGTSDWHATRTDFPGQP